MLCHDGTEWSTRRNGQQKTLWTRNSPCGKQADKEETISKMTNNEILKEYIQYFFPYNSETLLKDRNMNDNMNMNTVFFALNMINMKTFFCTSYCFLHILLFCTSYCFALFVLHILLLFLFFFTIYMLLCCVTFI